MKSSVSHTKSNVQCTYLMLPIKMMVGLESPGFHLLQNKVRIVLVLGSNIKLKHGGGGLLYDLMSRPPCSILVNFVGVSYVKLIQVTQICRPQCRPNIFSTKFAVQRLPAQVTPNVLGGSISNRKKSSTIQPKVRLLVGHKVDVSKSNTTIVWAFIFECFVEPGVDPKNLPPKRHVFERELSTCSKHATHTRLNSQNVF